MYARPACAVNSALYGPNDNGTDPWPSLWPYDAQREPPWHMKCPACTQELKRGATGDGNRVAG
jgi:hypothetical protein